LPVSWKGQLAIRLPLLIGLAQPAGMIAELGDTHRAGAATLGFGIATSWCVSAMILPAALDSFALVVGKRGPFTANRRGTDFHLRLESDERGQRPDGG
jgi:hypothetical protein